MSYQEQPPYLPPEEVDTQFQNLQIGQEYEQGSQLYQQNFPPGEGIPAVYVDPQGYGIPPGYAMQQGYGIPQQYIDPQQQQQYAFPQQYVNPQQYSVAGQYGMPGQYFVPGQYYGPGQYVLPGQYVVPEQYGLPGQYSVQQEYGAVGGYYDPGASAAYVEPQTVKPRHLPEIIPLPPEVLQFYKSQKYNLQQPNKEAVYNRAYRRYLLTDILGRGTYAVVYKAIPAEQMNDSNPEGVAIKAMRYSRENKRAVKRENEVVDRLMAYPHQNILQFIQRFRSSNADTHYIVMELCPLGDLFEMLQVKTPSNVIWRPLHSQYCRHLIRGVAEGLQHMFSLGIAHGDLKLENILVYGSPNSVTDYFQMVPKLCDFNNSKLAQPGEQITHNSPRCTLYSAAPETYVFQRPCEYDMMIADVYSVGACLLSLLLGCQPFKPPRDYSEWTEMAKRTISMKKDKTFINQLVAVFEHRLKQVLIRTLEPQPQQRITIQEFLADDWFTQRMESQELEDYRNRYTRLLDQGIVGVGDLPQEKWLTRRFSI